MTGRNAEDAKNFSRAEHVACTLIVMRGRKSSSMWCGAFGTVLRTMPCCSTRQMGQFPSNPDKMHLLNHKGQAFSIKGPLSVRHPPARASGDHPGRPIGIRSRSFGSDRRRRLYHYSRHSKTRKAFYDELKGRRPNFSRSPDHLKICPASISTSGARLKKRRSAIMSFNL